MTKETELQLPPYARLHLGFLGSILGVGFWFFETAVHAFLFYDHSFFDELFPAEPNEFWMRLLICTMLILFGWLAQWLVSTYRQALYRIDNLKKELFAIINGIRDPILIHNERFEFLMANQAFYDLSGQDSDSLVGKFYWEAIPGMEEPPMEVESAVLSMVESEIVLGSGIIYHARSFPVFTTGGRYQFTVLLLTDLTKQREWEKSQRLASRVIALAPVAIIVTDPSAVIQTVNPAFTRITGYDEYEAIGKTPAILKSGKQDPTFYRQMWSELQSTGSWKGEICNRKKNGEYYIEWLEIESIRGRSNRILNYIGIFTDITQQKEAEATLIIHANYDPLTDMPNRRMFEEHLLKMIHRAERDNKRLALLFVDLDRFKPINDNFGHDVGDLVLQEISSRISASIRPSDVAARYGGDEFIISLSESPGENLLIEISERIIRSLSLPIYVEQLELTVGASIGIAVYPDHGRTMDDLVSASDIAMYRAKRKGGGRYMIANKMD